jgi:hypothetical protein
MKAILTFSVLVVLLAACSKDNFKTQPTVQITSFGPGEVHKGMVFTFFADVTDKEGDVQDSVLLVRKRFTGQNLLSVDTVRYSIANFGVPLKTKIQIEAKFDYGEVVDGTIFQNLESVDRNFAVGIIVRDKAGNKSDYVESNKIVLKKL